MAFNQGENLPTLVFKWRQWRKFIAIAHANEDWRQVAASFALEGIVLTDDDAERAGRMLAGEASEEELLAEVPAAHSDCAAP